MWGKKTAPNYFFHNFVKPRSILVSFGVHTLIIFYTICISRSLWSGTQGTSLRFI